MAILTLKKYLSDENTDARHLMTVMLNGMAATAVWTDAGEYNGLVADLDRIAEAAAKTPAVERLLAAAGSAVELLDGYNQRTTMFVRRQAAELRKVIGMLAETVITVTGSGELSAKALDEIKGHLVQAGGLEDLAQVKARLGVCLEQVCREAERRKEETEKTITALEDHIRRVEAHLKPDTDMDPVTELPGRLSAETALREASVQPGRKYLVAVVLDSLETVSARFGTTVGNQVLAALARYVEANLQPGDALFRWSGPALLAILPRQSSIDRLRSDLRPVFAKPLQKDIDIGGRDVLVPISPAWAVFGVVPPVATILKHVDTFVASQAPKDYL